MTIKLVRTSDACPEQYDAFLNGEPVGHLHLRHGSFRVSCPTCGGDEVFVAEPSGDGSFKPYERDSYLTAACLAIQLWVAKRDGRATALYEIVSQDEV